MSKELEILQQIHSNEYTTQRDLANTVGISIGAVNLLIKKMLITGLIKMEKLNTRTMRYILTPEGMAEKTAKTYQYMVRSYNNILQMQRAIISILEEQSINDIKNIYLFGKDDEVYKVIQIVFNDKTICKNINYKRINNIEDIVQNKKAIVLVWDTEKEEMLNKDSIKNINILKQMI